MSKVIFDKDGRIGRISLNRPEKLNAIDDDVPDLLPVSTVIRRYHLRNPVDNDLVG